MPLKTDDRVWMRIHRRGQAALFFGHTGTNRFDAWNDEFGVLYVSADAHGSFIETFGRETERQLVTAGELRARAISSVRFSRPLRLVDLTGRGLRRLGADGRLASGGHDVARRWSSALYAHPQAPDGLLYRARTDPSRLSAAVFDRVAPLAREELIGGLWEAVTRSLVEKILDSYGFGLIR